MTFLVMADFKLNAQLLDMSRIGKQRIEGRQILNIILGLSRSQSWSRHPIVQAWRPYPTALKYYINCIIEEFIRRGGRNNLPLFELPALILMPWWTQWERVHQSHRAMLMRKAPHYYGDKFSVDPEYMAHGYIWPGSIQEASPDSKKLPTVTYDNRNQPLAMIAAPIPKELVAPVYCKSVMRSGATCHRLIKDGAQCCRIHIPQV